MKISFVIPCYNAAANIAQVVLEIEQTMGQEAALAQGLSYEIILVNDASKDATAAVIAQLAASKAYITALDLAKNSGQPSALLAGFALAEGELIMTADDDGQTPVNRIFDFLAELDKGYDVVCARYPQREQPSFLRRLGSKCNSSMSDWLIEKPKGLYMSSFFLAKRFVITEIVKYKHSYPYIAGLILRTTHNIGNVDVEHRRRLSGSSGYNLRRLLHLWLNGFTAFSIKPLRIAIALGMSCSLIGFIMVVVILLRKLLLPAVASGWSSIIASVLSIGGLNILFLGLVGEYIGRIYMCINETPQYVIRSVSRQPAPSSAPTSEPTRANEPALGSPAGTSPELASTAGSRLETKPAEQSKGV